MGLIKAIVGAAGTVLADQWVDYFKCDAMDMNVLARKGKRTVGNKSSNTKYSSDVITDGSKVDVADGQFMAIVENGLVVDFCAEPGQYIYKTGTQPSLLSGGFTGLIDSFKEVGKRFVAGGQPTTSQYVYYFNTKELMGNKWGIGGVPFRDSEFDFTMKISAYGEYSYRITDPLMFYKNVCGNFASEYTRDLIDSQLKAELQAAMQPALGRIALKKIAYDQLPLFTKDIRDELNTELTAEWGAKRGLSVSSFAVAQVAPDEESAKKIAVFQESRVYTDGRMMGARLGTATANAMESAAANENGAVNAFMGVGMVNNAGNAANIGQYYNMPYEKKEAPAAPVTKADAAETWTCTCGALNTGNFCPQCGAKKPEEKHGWTCAKCGTENKGKFCSECGEKKPADEPLYRCDKCGWEPEDPKNPPKFCPQCGDRFDENDITK